MKKFLLLLTLLSTASGLCLAAQDDIVRDITIRRININTRSIDIAPEASIQNDVLSVSFDDSGMYSLYIEDNFGVTVYSSALPANGMEYDYDLSGISSASSSPVPPANTRDTSPSTKTPIP